MRFRLMPLVLLTLLAAACAAPAPAPVEAPKPDLAAEEAAIRDLDARWAKAVEARDAAGEAAMFAADGLAYRPNVDPMGPAAFEAFSAKTYADNPKQTSGWSTTAVHVADSGDLAIQTGEFHVTGFGPKADGEDRGRFVTVWKKVNGSWKVAHDISSTTMPVPVATKK